MLGFWIGLLWALKMPLGHLIVLIWKWKSILVFLGGLTHRCQSYHHAHPYQLSFSPLHLNEHVGMVCAGSDALPNWLCIAGCGR